MTELELRLISLVVKMSNNLPDIYLTEKVKDVLNEIEIEINKLSTTKS